MKRIIFIILFLITGIISAQTTWTKYGWKDGRKDTQVKGDTSAVMVYMMNEITVTGVNTKLDSLISDLYKSLLKLTNISTNSDSSFISDSIRNDILTKFRDTSLIKWNLLLAKDFATSALQDSVIQHLSRLKDSMEVWFPQLHTDNSTNGIKIDSLGVTVDRLEVLETAIKNNIIATKDTLHLVRVDLSLLHTDLVNLKKSVDSVDATTSRSETKLGEIYTRLGNGTLLTKPYNYFIRYTDTWGAGADTSTYNFNNDYLKGYITVYDTSATADTLVFEHYSYAKNNWTTNAIGFRDVLTEAIEADNTTIILSGATAKTWEINMLRPGNVRIRPKTVGGHAVKTKRIVFTGVN